jgi:hypothetical protein
MRHLPATVLLLCGCLWAGPALAGDEDEGDEPTAAPAEKDAPAAATSDDAPPSAVHHEGDYGGVTPDQAKNPADGKRAARKGRAASRLLVTWVGFQARDGGGARVFVQLSAEATYEQKLVGDALVVFVAGARLGQRNHGRFIDTSFFDTAVARVEARNVAARRGQKAGVELTVHFKKGAAKNADVKEENGADGHRYLFLDFAP